MIQLWISRRASLPIREQLAAQLLLGILSRKLAPGEKLPSVRDLARRLKIHGNTVLAVYRDLAQRGWVQAQPGSGVFVREPPTGGIDDLIRTCIQDAQALGYSTSEIQAAFARHLQAPQHFIVVDSDGELARILAAEISTAAGRPIGSASCAEAARGLPPGTCALANSGQAEHAAEAVGRTPLRQFHLKSMQEVLAGQPRPAFAILIGFASRSAAVRAWAATLLGALGFDAANVLLRDPAQPGWLDGLTACHLIAADVVAAAELSEHFRPIIVRLIAERSLAEVCQLVTPEKVSQAAT